MDSCIISTFLVEVMVALMVGWISSSPRARVYSSSYVLGSPADFENLYDSISLSFSGLVSEVFFRCFSFWISFFDLLPSDNVSLSDVVSHRICSAESTLIIISVSSPAVAHLSVAATVLGESVIRLSIFLTTISSEDSVSSRSVCSRASMFSSLDRIESQTSSFLTFNSIGPDE